MSVIYERGQLHRPHSLIYSESQPSPSIPVPPPPPPPGGGGGAPIPPPLAPPTGLFSSGGNKSAPASRNKLNNEILKGFKLNKVAKPPKEKLHFEHQQSNDVAVSKDEIRKKLMAIFNAGKADPREKHFVRKSAENLVAPPRIAEVVVQPALYRKQSSPAILEPSFCIPLVNYGTSSATIAIRNDDPDVYRNEDPEAGVVTFTAQRSFESCTDSAYRPQPFTTSASTASFRNLLPDDLHQLPDVRVTSDPAASTTIHLLNSISPDQPNARVVLNTLQVVSQDSGGGGSISSRRSSVHWEDGGVSGRIDEVGAVSPPGGVVSPPGGVVIADTNNNNNNNGSGVKGVTWMNSADQGAVNAAFENNGDVIRSANGISADPIYIGGGSLSSMPVSPPIGQKRREMSATVQQAMRAANEAMERGDMAQYTQHLRRPDKSEQGERRRLSLTTDSLNGDRPFRPQVTGAGKASSKPNDFLELAILAALLSGIGLLSILFSRISRNAWRNGRRNRAVTYSHNSLFFSLFCIISSLLSIGIILRNHVFI